MTKNKNDLTVLTVVENDPGLLELMFRSIKKFTDPMPDVIVCDNTNGKNSKRIRDSVRATKLNVQVVNNAPPLLGGSNRHSDGLNRIFPMVTTEKTAIIESDCILLCPGWDYIDFPRHKMVAAKKGELAGQPFYHVCFMVFSTRLLKHNGIIDFRPGQAGNRSNRPYKEHEDVGHKIRDKVRPDEISYVEFRDCKEGNGFFFDKTFQSDEFWLSGHPIVAHFGRGSNLKGKAIRKGFKHPDKQLEAWKKIAEEVIK